MKERVTRQSALEFWHPVRNWAKMINITHNGSNDFLLFNLDQIKCWQEETNTLGLFCSNNRINFTAHVMVSVTNNHYQ